VYEKNYQVFSISDSKVKEYTLDVLTGAKKRTKKTLTTIQKEIRPTTICVG